MIQLTLATILAWSSQCCKIYLPLPANKSSLNFGIKSCRAHQSQQNGLVSHWLESLSRVWTPPSLLKVTSFQDKGFGEQDQSISIPLEPPVKSDSILTNPILSLECSNTLIKDLSGSQLPLSHLKSKLLPQDLDSNS